MRTNHRTHTRNDADLAQLSTAALREHVAAEPIELIDPDFDSFEVHGSDLYTLVGFRPHASLA